MRQDTGTFPIPPSCFLRGFLAFLVLKICSRYINTFDVITESLTVFLVRNIYFWIEISMNMNLDQFCLLPPPPCTWLSHRPVCIRGGCAISKSSMNVWMYEWMSCQFMKINYSPVFGPAEIKGQLSSVKIAPIVVTPVSKQQLDPLV